MSEKIKALQKGEGGNYIFPFFWQHGETETVLREYMKVIHEANIGAVCVESRPHPDFCGEQWWHDMDIILEEAKRYGMKVWILDDRFHAAFVPQTPIPKSKKASSDAANPRIQSVSIFLNTALQRNVDTHSRF